MWSTPPSRPSRDERVGVGVGLNAGDGGSSLMLLLPEVDFGVELPAGVRLPAGGCVERLAAAAARDGDPNRGGFGGVTSRRDAGLP